MLDTLHLIRLLRNALTLLRESADQRDSDRVTRQLIADLQASLVHSTHETPDVPDMEREARDLRIWLVTEPLPA